MAPGYSEIIKVLGKHRVKLNEPLAKHTTFQIGGPADLFVEIEKETELIKLIKLVRVLDLPYFILGNGSKLLVADEGFRGIVIKIQNSKFSTSLKLRGASKIQDYTIIVDAGVSVPDLLEKLATEGYTGLEFLAGIPGTVGGVVRGNAGAWLQQIGDKVNRVKILDDNNQIVWLSNKSCHFEYRQSRFKKTKEIILAVELELKKSDPKKIKAQIDEYLKQRQGQPKEPSVGSIFVNPKPKAAAELIEACGLKGKIIGKAKVSEKHANFIVNLGGAKASEVVKLIKLIKEKVKEKFGVELKEEVVYLGFGEVKIWQSL